MRKAIQFGGGNIGRGFTGQLFSESGYEVVFVDVVEQLVNDLNERGCYPIRMATDKPWVLTVNNVRAVSGRDISAVGEEIKTADIMCTAVGVNVLPYIAPAIAAGVQARADAGVKVPINIIICENLQNMSGFLREKVREALNSTYHVYLDNYIGFVESVVGRMVPIMTEEQKREDPLLVIVEPYKHLPIAKAMIKGELPEIVGVEKADNFQSFVDRKLYTHNAGHATAAYLGYLKGYNLIYEAMADSDVMSVVRGALKETGDALITRHHLSPEAHQEHIEDLLARFANVALGDQVARVGRDPVRKLGPEDRLVGGANLALEYGIFPTNLCKAIAAALLFDPPGDPASQSLQHMVQESGVRSTIKNVSGISELSKLADDVASHYDSFRVKYNTLEE